jgi:hypothetical protein
MTVVGSPSTCPNGGGDCNDEVAAVHPNAIESCDGIDNDCSGAVDDVRVSVLNDNQLGACAGTYKACVGGAWVNNYASVPGYGKKESPDGAYLDENCDGIDGTIDDALFVAPSGADSGSCTMLAPCRTIGFAQLTATLARSFYCGD